MCPAKPWSGTCNWMCMKAILFLVLSKILQFHGKVWVSPDWNQIPKNYFYGSSKERNPKQHKPSFQCSCFSKLGQAGNWNSMLQIQTYHQYSDQIGSCLFNQKFHPSPEKFLLDKVSAEIRVSASVKGVFQKVNLQVYFVLLHYFLQNY